MAIKKPIRIYELYGYPGTTPSAQSRDYEGHVLHVVAVSIKQAYYLAAKSIWATDARLPHGIIQYYQKGRDGGDHRLWTGEWVYGGLNLSHGDTQSRILEVLESRRAA